MRRPRFVPVFLSSFALTASLLSSSMSRAAEQEVVRVGDRDLTCTALAAEINTLAQPDAEEAAAKPAKKHGFGFLKVLGSAVPLVGMANGMGGALLSSAAGAAQAAGAQGQAAGAMEQSNRFAREALAGGSAAQQRKERLTSIFEEKRC
ncbi:MAG: hypothetical protein JO157_03670 [Acetobacteraceae bacterium]|nr:hypothetical protein [Acetobacteraceae bacterium]